MKHTAKYLDSGFYTVSDKAAGELCRILGQKLPKIGWEKAVFLKTGDIAMNAWLKRTPTCLNEGRKWQWAIMGMRHDGGSLPIVLGKQFTFEAAATTAKAA